MAVKYSVLGRKNLLKPHDPDKYYAQAQSSGEEDFKGMTRAVADRCTVTASDAKAVLDAFQTIMIQRLESGQIVRLNDLGSFRMSVRSEGTEDEASFNATKIKKARIIFTPSADLKQMCKAVSYSKTNAITKSVDEDGGNGSLDPNDPNYVPDPTL